MNRSLPNVIFGGYGTSAPSTAVAAVVGVHTEIDVPGTVEALLGARKVVIVPGYGLAVANAQHTVAELVRMLGDKGVEVRGSAAGVEGRGVPARMRDGEGSTMWIVADTS